MQTISRQIQLFVTAVVALATIVAIASIRELPWQDWPQLLLFFIVIVVAFSARIPDPRGGAVTPSTVLSYLTIYLFDPQTALLVMGTARTVGYIISTSWVPWRALFNGCLMALSVAIGSYCFSLAGGTPGRIVFPDVLPALIIGPLAHQVANHFFVSFAISQVRGTPFLNTWFTGVLDLFWPSLLNIPTATVLAIVYVKVHYLAVLAYLALLPLQWLALNRYIRRRQLYAQIIDGLVVATDVNFPLGRGHARRVADLAVTISREMRLNEATVESIQFAALLHDVGMIGKDDVLERSILSEEDLGSLRDHVRVGAEIAKELPRKEIAAFILSHHERYDGTGYPEGRRGESIPLGARIIALAELIDSMATGTFPYSTTFSGAAILSYVTAERGRTFDPEVVDAFLRAVERGTLPLAESSQSLMMTPRQPLGETRAQS